MSDVSGLHGSVFHGFKRFYDCNLVAFWAVSTSTSRCHWSFAFMDLNDFTVVIFWSHFGLWVPPPCGSLLVKCFDR